MLQRHAALLILLVASLPSVALAQPDPSTEPADVEVAPISCWWQTSDPAIRVGQRFWVTLTCAVLETESTKVVPDESRLEGSAIQIPPFEVLNSARDTDLHTATRRFFQYDYETVLIVENAFNVDVSIPPVEITYTVETTVESGEALQGREQTYTMPPLALRVTSLVPQGATDIRSSEGGPSFGDLADRYQKARTLRAGALVLFALAGILALVALVGAARRRMAPAAAETSRLLPARAIVGGTADELDEIARRRQIEGWTPELTGRALSAARIAAAIATGAIVGQRLQDEDHQALEGQLAITAGFPKKTTALVSAGVTAEGLGRDRRRPGAARTAAAEELAGALRTFTEARYGRQDGAEASALDDALAAARRAADRLRAEHTVVAELLAGLRRGLAGLGTRAWSR
ncbi:MAG: hypothetical protein AB7H88_16745 [Vicinamibacterales bacterium]